MIYFWLFPSLLESSKIKVLDCHLRGDDNNTVHILGGVNPELVEELIQWCPNNPVDSCQNCVSKQSIAIAGNRGYRKSYLNHYGAICKVECVILVRCVVSVSRLSLEYRAKQLILDNDTE